MPTCKKYNNVVCQCVFDVPSLVARVSTLLHVGSEDR